MTVTSAVEPQLDLAARVRHVIDERILRGQTTRVVEISGVKYTLRDLGSHLSVIAVRNTGHRVEINCALFNHHNDVLIVGGVKGATTLKLPKLRMHMHEESSGVELEHGFWVTIRKLVESAYMEDPPSEVTAGVEDELEAGSLVLFKTPDILAIACETDEGYAYELAGISPAGNDISTRLGRTGVLRRVAAGLLFGDTMLPGLEGDAAYAVLRDHLQRQVEAAAEPMTDLEGPELFAAYKAALSEFTRSHKNAVVFSEGPFKVHVRGAVAFDRLYGSFELYTTVNNKRVYTMWQSSDFSLPFLGFALKPAGAYGYKLEVVVDLQGFFQSMDERQRIQHVTPPQPKKIASTLITILRQELPALLKHVKLDEVTYSQDEAATAAVEPQPALLPTAELFAAYWADLLAYMKKHPNAVVLEHGNVKVHITDDVNDADRGLFDLYTTVNGVRVNTYDKHNDADWPLPLMRFHMSANDMVSFSFGIVDLAARDHREHIKTVSVKRVQPEKFVKLALAVLKQVGPTMLAYVNIENVVTSATSSAAYAVARSLGADAKKLIGKTVLGFKVESATILIGDEDLVGFSCSGDGAEAFIRVTQDKAVTAYVYHGIRRTKHSSELANTRLGSIVAALQFEEEPKEVNAAVEPQSESNGIRTLTKLQGLKISSKHFHIKIRPQAKPSVDDHGNAYILGDIVSDAHAQAVYGEPDFRYGFTLMLPGSADHKVSDTNDFVLKLPHIYPSIAKPESVQIRKEVGANSDDASAVARNIAKLIKPWFDALDAEVENHADMVALLHADFKPSSAVEFYRIVPTYFDLRKPGAPRSVRVDPYGNRVVRLKFELTSKAQDDVLDDKAKAGLGFSHVFDLSVVPGNKPSTLQISAVAGKADHADNFDGKPMERWSPAVVGTDRAQAIVQSWINDYFFKLDSAYTRVDNS